MKIRKNINFNTTDVKFELLLLYGEVNELFQAWLKEDQENINEELADVAIFLLGISEMLGSDLGEDIVKKMAINAKRKYVHGVLMRVVILLHQTTSFKRFMN